MKRRAAGDEARALRIIDSVNQAHELARHVAMKPGRPKGVLHAEPSRREHDEVDIAGPGRIAGRMQHQKYRRVGVIVGRRAHRVEAAQIIFIRRMIAVPRHHIERGVVDLRGPQTPEEFGDESVWRIDILEARVGRQKISRVREAIRTDRSQIRQLEGRAEILANVAPAHAVRQAHPESQASRHHGNLLRLHIQCGPSQCRWSRFRAAERSRALHRHCRKIVRASIDWRHRDRCRSPIVRSPSRFRPSAYRPSMKSVGVVGNGSGSQRS